MEHKDNVAAQLSAKDYEELVMLAEEPIENNTISLEEFKISMEKWRIR